MYIQLKVRITYSLGAVLSRILIPSLGSSFPKIQGYAVQSYTVKKLYNCIVIIRQIKRIRYIQAMVVVCENHSRMYASRAVGRRRVRVGRPEPYAD